MKTSDPGTAIGEELRVQAQRIADARLLGCLLRERLARLHELTGLQPPESGR